MSVEDEVVMDKFVEGTCERMCPQQEMIMREREGLLHRFELVPGSGRGKGRRARCRPDRMVKQYSRPAAGKLDSQPEELRPAPTLVAVTDYLIDRIVPRKDVPWSVVYEFVFDRLRAVRQDMVIQRIEGPAAIYILERAVRFHIYAGYRLCTEPASHIYDSKINAIHAQSCLKKLLLLYDDNDASNCNMGEFASLYLMYNLGHVDALQYVLRRKKRLISSPDVKVSLTASLSWLLGNFIRVFRVIHDMTALLCCAVHSHLGLMHRHAVQVMSAGFSSPNLSFPLADLSRLLLLDSAQEAAALCNQHGLHVSNQRVNFIKSSFQYVSQIQVKHYHFIEEKLLDNELQDILHGHIMSKGGS